MGKRIKLTFIDDDISVEAALLEKEAPRTCETIWKCLPLENEAVHAIYSGSEIAFFIPDDIIIEPENQTSNTMPGDLTYYHLAPGVMYGWQDGLSEIAWFYDRDCRPSMPDGPVMMNVFARFMDDAAAFYNACRQMRREGAKSVRVERVEQISRL